MTEIEFEKALVELAHMFDWKVASFRPAQTGKGWRTPVKYDGKGYPDLTMVHPSGVIIFAELKAKNGKVSDDQRAWGQHFLGCIDSMFPSTDVVLEGEPLTRVQYWIWKPEHAAEIATIISFGRITDWRLE